MPMNIAAHVNTNSVFITNRAKAVGSKKLRPYASIEYASILHFYLTDILSAKQFKRNFDLKKFGMFCLHFGK